MKKRLLPIILTIILIMTFIPFGPAAVATGEFTATLMGQLDTDVNADVPEWGIESHPGAVVQLNLHEPVTMSLEFDDPVKFTGNWTGIEVNVPVNSDAAARVIGAQILDFVVDGEGLGSRSVPVVDRDDAGKFTLDIARQWGGSYDPYGLADMDPFSTLEITFVVGHIATLMGQLDADVNTDVPEWGIGDIPEARTALKVGEPATIKMEFSNPIKFTGNWTGIATSLQVESDEDAESTGAHIMHFIIDGNDLGSEIVPLINRDNSGFMTIDIARQWGGNYDAYDLAGMDPFTTLEITFIVPNMPESVGDVPPPAEVEVPDDITMSGNAWIGGTFLTDEGEFDWIPYEDQKTPFTVGEPFTVTLDMGSEKQTHGEASWGYITVVQTDIMDSAALYDAYIDKILVDGREIPFFPHNIEVGFDNGVRIALTSFWAEDPVVETPRVIGEFSKLEVVMAFTVVGEDSPFGAVEPPPPPTPPLVVDPIRPPDPVPEATNDGLPGWVIPVIIAGVVVIALVIVLVVLKSKKKSS